LRSRVQISTFEIIQTLNQELPTQKFFDILVRAS